MRDLLSGGGEGVIEALGLPEWIIELVGEALETAVGLDRRPGK
jgi:hypothetical protein